MDCVVTASRHETLALYIFFVIFYFEEEIIAEFLGVYVWYFFNGGFDL